MNCKCLLCKRDLEYSLSLAWIFSLDPFKEKFICDDCQSCFQRIDGPTCMGCGRMCASQYCADCVRWRKVGKPLLDNQALYCYHNEAMRDYFEQYKFAGDYYLRKVFQAEFQQFIRQKYPQRKWKYCIIPVDQQTMVSERRFNQVKGLTAKLKTEEWLVMSDDRHRVKQSHKNRAERMQTQQPFILQSPAKVKNQFVVLIDDIYTTGRTLYHAQDLLLKAGAAEIRSVTLAR